MSDETQIKSLDAKALTMICLACAAVAIGVLVIDMQIARNLAQRAQEIDGSLRVKRWDDEIARMGGTTSGTPFGRNYNGHSVDRNSGVETGKNPADPEIPMEGWDVFPVDRSQTHRAPGSRNLEVPESNGSVEP